MSRPTGRVRCGFFGIDTLVFQSACTRDSQHFELAADHAIYGARGAHGPAEQAHIVFVSTRHNTNRWLPLGVIFEYASRNS